MHGFVTIPAAGQPKDSRVRRRCCKFRVREHRSSSSNVTEISARGQRLRCHSRKFGSDPLFECPVEISCKERPPWRFALAGTPQRALPNRVTPAAGKLSRVCFTRTTTSSTTAGTKTNRRPIRLPARPVRHGTASLAAATGGVLIVGWSLGN